jgi:hypothetical protein
MSGRLGYVSLLSVALAVIVAVAFLVSPTWGTLDSFLEPLSVLGFVGVYFGWAVTAALPTLRSKAGVAAISIPLNALLYGMVLLAIQRAVRFIRRKQNTK